MAESQELQRITDKYSGVKLCEMRSEELEEFLGGIAKRSSMETLKNIGLNDENALADIRDLRDLLRAARAIRKTAISTTLSTFGRILGWAVVLLLAGFFLHTSPVMKRTVVDLMAP